MTLSVFELYQKRKIISYHGPLVKYLGIQDPMFFIETVDFSQQCQAQADSAESAAQILKDLMGSRMGEAGAN